MIINALSCTIPVSVLRGAPYFLSWGDSVYATVMATNIIGDSLVSEQGNGAVILRVPEPPYNLVDVPEITLGEQIGLNWLPPANQGGTEVLDYRISYDQGAGNGIFVEYLSGISTTFYTVVGVNRGTTYTFKVQARNAFGYSDYSETVTILAA